LDAFDWTRTFAGAVLLFIQSPLNSARQAIEQMKCFCCYGQWRKWQWIWKYADGSTWKSNSTEFRAATVSMLPPSWLTLKASLLLAHHRVANNV
jgi:hypothetical protein